ncbi:hypothetical protein C6H88_00895 [Chlamydia muridarum str. Nigg]|uniref:hypothetical protein n=1 Tax=Chlamydia muridarum TaxID=83560 RepID=UPI0009B5CC8B|nr:hypothetical protein [Chlamydia muridarum]UFX34457.1 hypothetical protein FTM63_00980 [Chlamydia trachomatis]AVM87962.1 hypothetical protein C6H96_00895 [Chlamydia muridarum str. Nigg]AVM88847.1 hypothetical protein C6H95_00895 [Chlamydia muridarum str. Nigg]AVM89747.1 hypothetical protein C6H94_00895 [Chlamydia muridarum str. Nigg]AVM90643.1 hypothetical protein C6H93_00890 [Chlamydia muridarum str. Nigg]
MNIKLQNQYLIDILSCFVCLLMMLNPLGGLISGCLGYLLAKRKNRGAIRWFFATLFFGLIAGIFLVALRPNPKKN